MSKSTFFNLNFKKAKIKFQQARKFDKTTRLTKINKFFSK